ncbi:hypothetical protein C8R44DRAFT_726104 [Mycena epipterygia]|nr:hypothetical protein C8R44DRAFT_726104 [Mycena epipterygia]
MSEYVTASESPDEISRECFSSSSLTHSPSASNHPAVWGFIYSQLDFISEVPTAVHGNSSEFNFLPPTRREGGHPESCRITHPFLLDTIPADRHGPGTGWLQADVPYEHGRLMILDHRSPTALLESLFARYLIPRTPLMSKIDTSGAYFGAVFKSEVDGPSHPKRRPRMIYLPMRMSSSYVRGELERIAHEIPETDGTQLEELFPDIHQRIQVLLDTTVEEMH